MQNRNTSLMIDFLAAVLVLLIVGLVFLIGDRIFFEGRLSGRYQYSKIYQIRKEIAEEKIRNIQLEENMMLTQQALKDLRLQNQLLIEKITPALPNDVAQYLEKTGNSAFTFFKALYPIVQDIGEIAQLKLVQGKFYLGTPILFASGSTKLTQEAKQHLKQVATTLKLLADKLPDGPRWMIRVEGYTDKTPPHHETPLKNNWNISTTRALAVVDYLTHKGIDGGLLVVTGHGPYQSETQSQLLGLPHQRFVTLVVDAG